MSAEEEKRRDVVAKIDASLKFAPRDCREAMLAARELLKPNPELKLQKKSCNRHDDCDVADERARKNGQSFGADHCHDECCSDCFGD